MAPWLLSMPKHTDGSARTKNRCSQGLNADCWLIFTSTHGERSEWCRTPSAARQTCSASRAWQWGSGWSLDPTPLLWTKDASYIRHVSLITYTQSINCVYIRLLRCSFVRIGKYCKRLLHSRRFRGNCDYQVGYTLRTLIWWPTIVH